MGTVTANTQACQGHARCALLAPDHFDVDDYGKVVVLRADVGEDDLAEVEEAVISCPELALSLG